MKLTGSEETEKRTPSDTIPFNFSKGGALSAMPTALESHGQIWESLEHSYDGANPERLLDASYNPQTHFAAIRNSAVEYQETMLLPAADAPASVYHGPMQGIEVLNGLGIGSPRRTI